MGNIAPVNLPEPSGDFTMTNPKYSSKQAFIDRHKTQRKPPGGLTLRTPVQIAATPKPGPVDEIAQRKPPGGLTLRTPVQIAATPKPRPVDEIAQRKPKGPGRTAITGPEESSAQKIARLAKAKKAATPIRAPRRRAISGEEPDEETPEERIERRAKETALPRFNGPVLQELKRQVDTIDKRGYGGKRKRKNRLKTGRKV
jgi:hypothetical protein